MILTWTKSIRSLRPGLWAGCLICVVSMLQARELTAYHVGDIAETDVITPLALDVADPTATAALRATKSQQFPAIFRNFPGATNAIAREFLTAFTQARTNFLADLAIEFHSATVPEASIASANFGRLVTVFGVENRNFPTTDELAAEWARGGDGWAIREHLLATLQWAMSRPVRPDPLPPGMDLGETVRLVPVADPNEKLSFELVQRGPLMPASSLITVSNAQALFRHEFPAEQQLFARALAGLLRPNCYPDAPYTQLTRGTAVYKLTVCDHFDAGDILVRQGDAIDARAHAALTVLAEKLANEKPREEKPSASLPAPIAALAPGATPPPPKPTLSVTPTPSVRVTATQSPAAKMPPTLPTDQPRANLTMMLVGISGVALLVAGVQLVRQRRHANPTSPTELASAPLSVVVKDQVAPQVAQVVREAVQQELAMQRRELLIAQQTAAQEITALVKRLDEMQMPMAERLRTYETRIQALEKELGQRNEENRELLKLKIEMVTRQLQNERAASLIPPISA